ncbi:MAG: hypothetical protein VX475_09280 [Myxococcota bacterium]|nr:hypothetical protein [Myxococcota bacterium]
MMHVFRPLTSEVVGARRDKVLWLRGGGEPLRLRDDRFHMPAVVVFIRWDGDHTFPFVSRIVGVTTSFEFEVEREMARKVKNLEFGVLRQRSYEGLGEGDYLATSMILPRQGGDASEQLVYINYKHSRGFTLLTPLQMAARWRGMVGADFGDVRSLVAQQDWERAERAAQWIESPREREAAAHYVQSCRARQAIYQEGT